MTYSDVASVAESYSLNRRLNGGAASEAIPDPTAWVDTYRWELAAQPGWSDAWASAVASGNPDPGADEAVITDGMILSGIQSVAAAHTIE